MIGVQDFICYYDWTFEYLRKMYGEVALEKYWAESIAFNSQNHANVLILAKGVEGMAEYWGATLTSEDAGFRTLKTPECFRIDMYICPSKGLLLEIGQEAYHDYCQHCIGWIKPIMDSAGFEIDHEHNHHGQCWWEMHPEIDERKVEIPPQIMDDKDVRLLDDWKKEKHDLWVRSNRVK
jgi:hypothetical protein